MNRPQVSATKIACLVASVGLAALPSKASAQECSSDADCEHGFSCEVTGGSTCPGVACPSDGDCPPPPPCESFEYSECVPSKNCESDADCASGMVCYEHTEGTCWDDAAPDPATSPTCPEGLECLIAPPMPPQSGCTETTVTACTPRWALPCTADADCGEGFTCTERIEQWCSGGLATPVSGGTAPAAGGDSQPDPDNDTAGEDPAPDNGALPPAPMPVPPPDGRIAPPECGSTPTGEFYCQAKEITCEANTDCPDGWLCKESRSASGGGVDCSQSVNPDGTIGEPVCEPVEPTPVEITKQCVPPYADSYGYGYDVATGDLVGVGQSETGSAGSSSIPTTTQSPPPRGPAGGNPSDPGAPPEPVDVDSDETSTASADDPATGTASDPESKHDDDGCQMAHGPAGSTAAFLLGILGLLGVTRRRRSA